MNRDCFDRYNSSKPAKLLIAEETRDNIKFPKDKKFSNWLAEFSKFNLTEQIEFFQHMERSQALYVRECMRVEQKVISLPKLGAFSFKQARKDYLDLKNNNPDMNLEDIVKTVKDRYRERLNQKSDKSSSPINKNITLNVVSPK
jgi:hypothetical protein